MPAYQFKRSQPPTTTQGPALQRFCARPSPTKSMTQAAAASASSLSMFATTMSTTLRLPIPRSPGSDERPTRDPVPTKPFDWVTHCERKSYGLLTTEAQRLQRLTTAGAAAAATASAVFMDTTMMADAKPETTKGITFEGKHLKYSRVNQNQSIYYRCPTGCAYTGLSVEKIENMIHNLRSREGQGQQRFRQPPLSIVACDDARKWFQFDFYGDVNPSKDEYSHMMGWAHPGTLKRARMETLE